MNECALEAFLCSLSSAPREEAARLEIAASFTLGTAIFISLPTLEGSHVPVGPCPRFWS